MIAILLRFWPHILAILAVVGLFFLINYWRVEAAKVRPLEQQVESLNQQLIAEREQVKKGRELTETVEVTYETRLANLNNLLDSLRKRPARCVPVATQASNASTTTAGAKLPSGNAGVTDSALYELAGKCEKERLKLLGTQDFINKLYGE